MIATAFTEFRNKAASFLDRVERGETIIVTRHGRPVAEIIPPSSRGDKKSWKRPAVRLTIKGLSLSGEIRADREKNRS